MSQGEVKGRAAAHDEARWKVVSTRCYDASFVYAVTTTGIYCRPDCPSRRPLRKHVAFFATPIAAESTGYRPCKRCRPSERFGESSQSDPMAGPVVRMCQLLETSDAEPSLRELAEWAKLSASHAHRVFSRLVGLTPKAYRTAVVRRRVAEQLDARRSVTQTIYAAGFGASSRFYERAAHLLGMSPSEYQRGAAGLEIHFAVGECALGSFLVAATERGVCAVYLGDSPDELVAALQVRFSTAELIGADERFESTVAQVVALIENQASPKSVGLPLDIRGTAFQERVFRVLGQIPRGTTVTYSHLATAVGSPQAVRAVASACARNELAVLVPCHRVIRTDGSLSGYRWGVERKRELLNRERS